MNKFRLTIKLTVIAAFVLAFASMAQAQATRTWVSGVGDDVNPCSRTAPCKTFAGAISKTAAGGEIDALDPGGFGAVTITKSMTIDGTQGAGFGSILAAGTSGVVVNDGASGSPNTIIVRLRNLSINGATTGIHGVNAVSFKKLTIENCAIAGFQSSASSRGIRVALTVSASQQVNVSDTNITNCASGVEMSNSGGNLAFTFDRVRLQSMTDGMIVGANANGLFRNSISSLNSGGAIKFIAGGSTVAMEHALLSQNGTGVQMFAGATAVFSNTTVIGNAVGLSAGGTTSSHGNNQFNLNAGGVLPPIIGQQ